MNGKPWTDIDLQVLRMTYPSVPSKNIAATLERTASQVNSKAHALGLKKTHEVKAEMAWNAIHQPGHRARESGFKKGQKPWNTGTKGLAGQAEGCKRTQFKPGVKPWTTVPLGSFRVVDGILEQKFSEDPGPYTKRWKSFHRIVWEREHGPIPEGHRVAFKAGRKTTDPALVTLDALELVTYAEMMARNTIHQLHPALADIARLRGTLKRAITRREKDQLP